MLVLGKKQSVDTDHGLVTALRERRLLCARLRSAALIEAAELNRDATPIVPSTLRKAYVYCNCNANKAEEINFVI